MLPVRYMLIAKNGILSARFFSYLLNFLLFKAYQSVGSLLPCGNLFGKGLTSLLSFVMFNCIFVTFPCGILGKVWYLIVSIPDLCHLSYFLMQVTVFRWS